MFGIDPIVTLCIVALVFLTAMLFYRLGLEEGETRGMIMMMDEQKECKEFLRRTEGTKYDK